MKVIYVAGKAIACTALLLAMAPHLPECEGIEEPKTRLLASNEIVY